MKKVLLVAAAVAVLAWPVAAQQTFSPDAEGFIRNWLVLAPIPMAGQSGAEEIDVEFIKGEGTLKPSADAEVKLPGGTLKWQAHQTFADYIDFRESFDKNAGEYVIGYAVTYVVAEAPMNVTLAVGTNDQGKVWFNGKEVVRFPDTRVLDKDADKVPVSLVKGTNVLVMKVINEVNSWQACARFLNGTTPVTNVKVSLTPQ